MKGGALVVERQSMTGLLDAVVEIAIGQFEREQPFAYAARHLVDRQSIGRHSIPEPQEFDLLNRAVASLVITVAEQSQHRIAYPAERRLEPEHGVKQIGTIGPIGQFGILIEFGV